MRILGSIENPIKCDGPLGERSYLSRLLGPQKQFLFFKRKGSRHSLITKNMIDIYIIASLDGNFQQTLHFDMYHPGYEEQNLPPHFLQQEEPTSSEEKSGHFISAVQKEAQLNQLLKLIFKHHGPGGLLARTGLTGLMALLVVIFLALFLLIYFI